MHEKEADGGYVVAPFQLEDFSCSKAHPHGCDETHEESFESWCQVSYDVRGHLLALRRGLFMIRKSEVAA